MRTLYITTVTMDGKAHNFRMSPNEFALDNGESVTAVREGTWHVLDMISPEDTARLARFSKSLSGVAVRG